MQNVSLWRKIEGIDLDEVDADFPFSRRLMRDNNWTLDFTTNAILEYKRFVYLAIVSDKPVTPSDQVDQVWHLHLVYTHHYWGDFSTILGKNLHHGPTKGGTIEREKFLNSINTR